MTFFSISGSEFVEMFVGVGAARVRDLFEQARKSAPAIIFIDELDALGRARSSGQIAGGHDEREQTLNQLLTELDGFDPSVGIVLLAATNRPEILDPALLRAGRFDRQVLVDRPDKTGRVQILNVHMKKVTLAPDVDAEKVAALTPGSSGADLANLVNEAALLATRRKADAVTMDDFNNAVERIIAGLEKKNRVLNPREREIVAHHEMGHALVAMALPGVDPVHKSRSYRAGLARSATPSSADRGPLPDDAGGTRNQDRSPAWRARSREDHLRSCLDRGGGRSGQGDRHRPRHGRAVRDGRRPRACQLRHRSARLSRHRRPVFLANRRYSDATAERMDAKVRDIVDGVFKRTLTFLETNLDLLEQSAQDLLQRETGRCVTLSLAQMIGEQP
ncbi:ATP-dependent Zn protease [Brevundimonas bullata]|uniref:ATP-dependent Zn protease n=1 Tax=Brevundimonas bullata TaxID=13160 RepID=A0A7W7N4W8_9CAUL|nr:ATP-dependent Zn protease [Brevundimonas bullata]